MCFRTLGSNVTLFLTIQILNIATFVLLIKCFFDNFKRILDKVYQDFKTPFLYNGHKWTLKVGETLFLTIDHFCKLVNSFITRTGILKRNDVEDYDLSQYPFWVQMINQTLYDNKNNTDLIKKVIPFIKNVSHYWCYSSF